jgi:DNA-binding winged helix-turn-helix (wHTH) protein/tetratricopeptide (TPR) repeat protein
MSATAIPTQTPSIAAQWTTAAFGGGCTLHLGHREVSRGDDILMLEPRAFDVLVHLIQHRHRTVTKAELLSACWGENPPSDGALARTIMKVRQATHDFDGGSPLIMTVHRVGYRFVGEVEFDVVRGRTGAVETLPAGAQTLQARRLMLMPLINMTGDDSFAWIELGLLSLVTKSLLSVPNLSIVPVRDVLAAIGGATSREGIAKQLELADAALGATLCIWGELRGSYGRLLLHYNLRRSDSQVTQGTVVGSDAVKIALEAAMHLRSWLMPDSHASVELSGSVDLHDEFLNQTFARAIQHSREERLIEAEHLFDVLQDAGVSNPRVLHESTRVAVVLGRPHASTWLGTVEATAREAGDPWLMAVSHELRANHLELRGRVADSVASTLKAIEIAQEHGFDDLTVRLMVTCAGRMAMGSDERAEALLSRAIPGAERLGNRVLLCDAYCAAARVAGFRNDWTTALRHQTAAVAIARNMHEASRSWAYGGLSWVQTSLGQLNAAADSADSAFRMARISGAQPQQGLAVGQAVLAFLAKRRIRETAQLYEAMNGSNDTSVAMLMARDVYCRATFLCAADQFDSALRIIEEMCRATDDHPRLSARCRAHLLRALLLAGRLDELEAACHSMRDIANSNPDYRLGPQVERMQAFVDHLQRRDTESALRRLHAVVDSLAASEAHARISLDCAWLHLERREVAAATALVSHLHQWLEESPAGNLVAARLRYEVGDFSGAVSVQQAIVAEYPQVVLPMHGELLGIYEHARDTGVAGVIPVLYEPINMHFRFTPSVRNELPAALGGPDASSVEPLARTPVTR